MDVIRTMEQNITASTVPANNTAVYLYLEDHFAWVVITAFVIGGAGLVGTFGNILIITAICLVKGLRTPGNMFVLNLTLADLIVTVFVDPFNVLGAVNGRAALRDHPVLCEWVATICSPTCLTSTWSMCAISINRYILICKPHLYHKMFTFRSSIVVCGLIWLLAVVVHLPNHLGWGRGLFNDHYYACTLSLHPHSYAVFYFVMGALVPLVGVLFGYTAIFMKVRGAKHQLKHHVQQSAEGKLKPTSSKHTSKFGFNIDDLKLAKTMFAAFVVFLICWSPLLLFILAEDPPEVPRVLFVIAIIMAHGNSFVNPVLYGLMNEKFRDGYRQVLGFGKASSVRPGPTSHTNKSQNDKQSIMTGRTTASAK